MCTRIASCLAVSARTIKALTIHVWTVSDRGETPEGWGGRRSVLWDAAGEPEGVEWVTHGGERTVKERERQVGEHSKRLASGFVFARRSGLRTRWRFTGRKSSHPTNQRVGVGSRIVTD